MSDLMCIICYDKLELQEASVIICGHMFHSACIEECLKPWTQDDELYYDFDMPQKNVCPKCRRSFRNVVKLYPETSNQVESSAESVDINRLNAEKEELTEVIKELQEKIFVPLADSATQTDSLGLDGCSLSGHVASVLPLFPSLGTELASVSSLRPSLGTELATAPSLSPALGPELASAPSLNRALSGESVSLDSSILPEEPHRRVLWIGGLSPENPINSYDIRNHFRRFGQVLRAWVSERPRGFGSVTLQILLMRYAHSKKGTPAFFEEIR